MRALPLLLLLAACKPTPPAPAPPPPAIANFLSEDGFEKMGPAQPGEWLDRFPEKGQTFEDYTEECLNRHSKFRTTIYLKPLGTFDAAYTKALGQLREYCEIFFGVPCTVLDAGPLPDTALVPARNQYDATKLINHLRRSLPGDGLAIAGITNRDLFAEGLNFVFGQGSLGNRCGVYSLHRYEHEPSRFLWRGAQTLTHELGHILGIEHCIRWKCVMCGSNSLAESDRHPLHLCPEDLRKLHWNTGVDLKSRYEKLRDFYRAAGFPEDAAWVGRRLGDK